MFEIKCGILRVVEVGVQGVQLHITANNFLADQLTLFQPGEQIMPTTLLFAHPVLFASAPLLYFLLCFRSSIKQEFTRSSLSTLKYKVHDF